MAQGPRPHDLAGYWRLGAVRRAARTAVVVPTLFAIGQKVIGNPTVALFAAFGAFGLLLLVEFGGPARDRARAQVALSLAGAVLICLGTLATRAAWLSVLTIALLGFVVLFSGVVSSVMAGATTTLLQCVILALSVPGRASSIPERLEGWGLASLGALLAIIFLWPSPIEDPLRTPAARACRSLAARLRQELSGTRAVGAPTDQAGAPLLTESDGVDALQAAFIRAPNRPTGLSTSARMIVRLVDELTWVNAIASDHFAVDDGAALAPEVTDVIAAAAGVLDQGADVLGSPDVGDEKLAQGQADLIAAVGRLDADAAVRASATVAYRGVAPEAPEQLPLRVSALDSTFRAQEVAYAVGLIAGNIRVAASAERRTWAQRLIGRQPEGAGGILASFKERASAHLERHSVWLHNSLRGACGLALAEVAVTLTSAQHSFWVVFATLSVLRSNALNTGQTIARGVLGTVGGFAVGSCLLTLIGTRSIVLWLLLPVAVLLAGTAPALISFAAGQAAFTVTLVFVFDLVEPTGWRLGLVRVEDVALGCGVSLIVGLLFWPRGAAAALYTALAEAYADGARYLDEAVRDALDVYDRPSEMRPAVQRGALRAAAASRRLDDAFRTYLAERGPKPVPLAGMTRLVTGVGALRLTAEAVYDVWRRPGVLPGEGWDRGRAELLERSSEVKADFDELALSLVTARSLLDLLPPEAPLGAPVGGSDPRALEDGKVLGQLGTRVVWTADLLDAARRLHMSLAAPKPAV